MLKTTFETVRGKRLRVARVGSGEPAIFLHGYPENLQIWCELVARLRGFECIALDWPGLGQSEAWGDGASPDDLAAEILALMDRWKLAHATIVGSDMGAQPALVFAAKHRDRVRRLVVMNFLAFPDAKTSWEIRVLRKLGWNASILRRLPGAVFTRVERTFLPKGVTLPDELRDDLWTTFSNREVRERIIAMCADFEAALPRLPDVYRTIRCPTLVLWAGRDKHFPPVHGERLRDAIPGSKLVVLEGAEHWMQWHQAPEVARLILT